MWTMSNEFTENFLEYAILPRWKGEVDTASITWKGHSKHDLDGWAHYFDDANGREYIVYNDDAGNQPSYGDGLSHEYVNPTNGTDVVLSFNDDTEVTGITGHYALYREIIR